nr:hypothetical protein [Tanacetum cinerariifolium]
MGEERIAKVKWVCVLGCEEFLDSCFSGKEGEQCGSLGNVWRSGTTIFECSSCGALYTTDYCCSDGSLEDRIICDLDKTPDLSQRPPQNCPKCGNPVDSQYCQGCAILRKKFKEDLFTYCIENEILQDSFEPSNDNTNVVNALQEPFVVNQDPVQIIPDPKPFNNQTDVELPQTLPSFDPTCYSEDENSFTYDSKSNLVHDSPNEEEKQIEEEQVAKAQYWNIPVCYDDDDDYTIAITHKEPDNSLSMGDEHLDTILAMESDEFIKSSVENLVPNPRESEGEYECDIDSLFDKFAGELTLLKSIPPGINETDCDPEEETHFVKRLLYDNSSPRPPKEFISENSDTALESFSLFPIPVEDIYSLMEEIDLSFTPDDPMPSGIEDDDYDSERDILILEELFSNDSLSLPENESFYFDIPSSSRPLAKPPDGNLGILNVKVMGDIYEHKVPMPRLMSTLVPNQEKSPNLLPYLGHKAFQPSVECPMMIYEKNTPILDVLFFNFYPP